MKEINKSGLNPVEYKILVELEETSDRTDGGLWIPISVKDKRDMFQVQATLIAAGGNAFEGWNKPVPKIGDKIYVAKGGGYRVIGLDEQKYQLMNDKDIAAVINKKGKD